MSLSSTQVTHGSVKSSSLSKPSKQTANSQCTNTTVTNDPASSTFHQTYSFPSSSTGNKDHSVWRIAAYAIDIANPNPEYRYNTSEESIRAHTTNMRSYLDEIDKHIVQSQTRCGQIVVNKPN
ncbi:hypothetical protein G7Y89_g11737 [Cudoniella acicularis]|uniref:Uncharacterized protein n=1 Tax=Cudoniella acicularis TaxID=354080 RepID=A0A8H4RDZ6_9HELO|nr:hypothetical protein G7Y89_g11737 [Cudoniella acicularis]